MELYIWTAVVVSRKEKCISHFTIGRIKRIRTIGGYRGKEDDR